MKNTQWFRDNKIESYIPTTTVTDDEIIGAAIHRPWLYASQLAFIITGADFGAASNGVVGIQGQKADGSWVFLKSVGRSPHTGAPGGEETDLIEGIMIGEDGKIDGKTVTWTVDLEELKNVDEEMTDIRFYSFVRDDVGTMTVNLMYAHLFASRTEPATELDIGWDLQHYDNVITS